MEQWRWPSNWGVDSGDPSSLTTTVQSPIYFYTVSCTQPLLLLLSVCNTNYQNVTDHLMSCIIKASRGSAAYNIGQWPWSWTRDYYYVCTGRNAQTWFGGSPSQVDWFNYKFHEEGKKLSLINSWSWMYVWYKKKFHFPFGHRISQVTYFNVTDS